MSKELRVVAIGLDGATWDLIEPWVKEGKLPAFEYLIINSASGFLNSTVPSLSPPAWTSIFTGLKPTKHGVWSFVTQKENSYSVRPIDSKDNKGKPLYAVLTGEGIRSVFLNIPFAYPPEKIDGIITTGLGTPSSNSKFCYPYDVKDEILSQFPDYNIDFNEEKILLKEDRSFIVDEIFRVTNAHIETFKHLYLREKELSKVFFIVLRSLDVIQHFFWGNEEVLLKFYQQADRFLSWCIENKGEDDVLLVCSDHGFRKVDEKICVNEWLKREGLLRENSSRSKFSRVLLPSTKFLRKVLVNTGFREVMWRLKRLEKLTSLLPSKELSYVTQIRWEDTDAYFLEFSAGIIQINLEGREPKGVVSKERYDDVRERVISRLSELRRPGEKDTVFEFVKKGEDIYEDFENSPDIIAYPKEGFMLIGGLGRTGRVFEKEAERNGDHACKGIFCAYGKAINEGISQDVAAWDIPAIILGFIGIKPPSCFDGKIPDGFFKESFLKNRQLVVPKVSDEKIRIQDSIRKAIKKGKI